ncbi:toxin co-regulated pilus biosynthesis Q family protein [Candidatus Fukatsuia symbiotica]|uniref:Toxin co-regulated pilus biosynthesis protein Q C-terminal domain-containing protein n=1 Tax=Candidatus Fukatsuia symbiotica TaxID=1878942 RepID=A0A2U8I8Y6_9GAMM|nr:toxin co-regulated pilus biosynthesis Q family protein [Candidatus Fukatsuia symbiotica]AWK15621.1 hypothetical protein CCS41_14485 [Candidatus Fukatsuia symbiotica]MEA9446218.1 toxin co-regulated pilus biosynthesis Q family protein [Candidatus Fukatsuia symbiotica]
MRIEPVIGMSLLACLLSACSSPPTLPEPKGVFIPANPEMPSYLSATNKSKILQTNKTNSKIRSVGVDTGKTVTDKISQPVVKPASNSISRPQKTEMLKSVVKPVTLPPPSPVSVGKNPFSATGAPIKAGIIPIVKPVPPPRIWRVKPGRTLKHVFMKWADDEKCHATKRWSVRWNTQTDYLIDSPLTFTGSFEAMTQKLFSLYRHANTPLYVDGYKAQCLIIINDPDKDQKKGR